MQIGTLVLDFCLRCYCLRGPRPSLMARAFPAGGALFFGARLYDLHLCRVVYLWLQFLYIFKPQIRSLAIIPVPSVGFWYHLGYSSPRFFTFCVLCISLLHCVGRANRAAICQAEQISRLRLTAPLDMSIYLTAFDDYDTRLGIYMVIQKSVFLQHHPPPPCLPFYSSYSADGPIVGYNKP